VSRPGQTSKSKGPLEPQKGRSSGRAAAGFPQELSENTQLRLKRLVRVPVATRGVWGTGSMETGRRTERAPRVR
jgi:hypothetical protein